jgi:hypothetical protein
MSEQLSLNNVTGRGKSGNDGLVPTANIVLSFTRDGIEDFFSFGTKSENQSANQSTYVFKPGDGLFLDLTHEISPRGSGSMFSLSLLDPKGEFLENLFSYTFEQALKEIYYRKKGASSPDAATAESPSKSGDFKFSESEKQELSLKFSTTKMYLAYGLGTETRNWAGPFIVNVANAFYVEDLNSANKLEIVFAGTDIVGDPRMETTSDDESYEVFSIEEPFAKVTKSVAYQSYAEALEERTFGQLAGDLAVGVTNFVREGWEDIDAGVEAYSRSMLERQAKDRGANVSLKFELLNKESPIEGVVYTLLRKYLKRLGYSNIIILLNALGDSIDTSEVEPVSVIDTIYDDISAKVEEFIINKFESLGFEVGDSAGVTSLFKEAPISSELVSDASSIKSYSLKLSLDSKEQSSDNQFYPILRFLKNFKTTTNTVFTNRVTIENNLNKVKLMNEFFPSLVTDPTSPVVIIGDDYLIQGLLYAKMNKSDMEIKIGGPQADLTLVHQAATPSYYNKMTQITNEKKAALAYFDFKDKTGYKNPRIPDDFSISLNENIESGRLGIPVFRANTENPNVLSFTSRNEGVLLSTYSNTVRQLVNFIIESAETNEESLDKSDVDRYVHELFRDRARVKNIASNLGIPINNESQVSDKLFNHLSDPDFIGLTYVSDSAPSVILASYMDNFYKMFSTPYTASMKTLPYYNLSELDLINDFCLLFKNRHKVLGMEDTLKFNSIYTGFWRFVGFKHVITSDDAYSEFTIIKDPISSNVFNN